MTPETCPNCGADVPRKAKSCPACGADEQTGWSDSAYADRLNIPDDNFNYQDYVKREFTPARVKPRGIHWLWWITALALIVFFLLCYLR
jgi:RNA polymerase subunit RPABC4/transcription elongation factor Spt4